MIGSQPTDLGLHDGLADYRATVERLRDETEAEFGRQPMPPEKMSMIATAVASLPLVALLLPTSPMQPAIWHLLLAQAAVWMVSFHFQRPRYHRFMTAWGVKVAAYDPVPAPVQHFRH